MKYETKNHHDQGFSLVEMLVVIAVIGIIAAIAVPSIGSISGQANTNKAKRNAQTIASLYNASRGVGAVYAADNTSDLIDELVAGKEGPELAGTSFKMSDLSDEEKTAAMAYVSYNSASDLMVFYPDGGVAAGDEQVAAWWGEWHPSDGGWVPAPLEWIPDKTQADAWAAEIGGAYPGYTFAAVQPVFGSAWKIHATPN